MFPLHPHDPPSVGPHRLRARLGEDAYARVYLGGERVEGPVAVKVVRPEYATDPSFRAAFTRQVEAARGLGGAYVCGVRDADLGGAVPWVAVARPPGPSLAELVAAHGPLPVEDLRALALALALALEELHAAGRAHGSLWPDGVLVSADAARLADPGLEWAISDTEQRAPHSAFAAPEGGATPATDVFSWASTLCYAASGVEGPDGLARVPLQLRGLIDTCLKRDPRLRPSAHDLVRMLGGPAEPAAWGSGVRARVERVAEAQAAALESDPGSGSGSGPGAGDGSGGTGGRGADRRRRVGPLAVGAAALTLVVLAGAGAVVALQGFGDDRDQDGPDPDPRAGTALVTGEGCPDDSGFPAPEDPPPEGTTYWDPVFSGDGRVLAATSSAGLTAWDWEAGTLLALPTADASAVVRPVFSPVGCTVAAGQSVDYEGREHAVRIGHTYDLATGEATEQLGGQEGPNADGLWTLKPKDVENLAFSPDGGLLAVTLYSTRREDSTVVVDTATGEAGATMAPGLHHSTVFVDDRHLATIANGTVHVWDSGTGEEVHSLTGATTTRLAAVPGRTQVAFLKDDRVVVSDYTTGTEVASFTRDEFESDDSPVLTRLQVDSGRERVYATWQVSTEAGAWRSRTYVWDLETGEDLAEGNGAIGAYSALVPHPDGTVLAASTTADSRLVLVDPDTFEEIGELG
ncbi:tyrosine protein kinase [Nocardiopsis sp. NPDC006938]|uniref:tyrosine protein kinase n=1 Tax=Nocardiopsis sp. NPDC006938 TaxID=3364337 RepID=UPI00367826C3